MLLKPKAGKTRGGDWGGGYILTESCHVVWAVEEEGKSEKNAQLILHVHPGVSVGMERHGPDMEVCSRLGKTL